MHINPYVVSCHALKASAAIVTHPVSLGEALGQVRALAAVSQVTGLQSSTAIFIVMERSFTCKNWYIMGPSLKRHATDLELAHVVQGQEQVVVKE